MYQSNKIIIKKKDSSLLFGRGQGSSPSSCAFSTLASFKDGAKKLRDHYNDIISLNHLQ
jgi:hypothetical protein